MWVVLGLIIRLMIVHGLIKGWGVKKLVSGPRLVRSVHRYKGKVCNRLPFSSNNQFSYSLSLFLSLPWRSGPLEVTQSFFLHTIPLKSIKNHNRHSFHKVCTKYNTNPLLYQCFLLLQYPSNSHLAMNFEIKMYYFFT